MIKKIGDWWYNRNKPYYMLPRGKDIGEPITTVVEDFLANRSKYKVLPRYQFYVDNFYGGYGILDKRTNILHLLFVDNLLVFKVKGVKGNNNETFDALPLPVGYLSTNEKLYLKKLYLGMVDYYKVLESCHEEWSEKADRKRLTKLIKECL